MNENLIVDLKEVMEEKGLSPENAAKFIGCSFNQVYRWLSGESKPTLIYRKAIRRGINRMKNLESVKLIK